MMKRAPKFYSGGQVMITVVILFLGLAMTIVFGVAKPILTQSSIAKENLLSKKSYYTAESGLEDIFIRLQKNTAIATNETLNLNGGTTTITTTNTVAGKQVISEGSVNSNIRKLMANIARGTGVVFRYGTQSGQGGIVLDNNSILDGSLYSNGNIMGSNGAQIKGDAIVAGSTGTIDNVDIGTGGTGNGFAHTILNSTATGILYCQTGTGNDKACNTSQADAPILPLPISTDEIEQWKSDATAGGTVTGDTSITTSSTIGPKKYVGNLSISGAATLNGTVYVTGNMTITGRVKLASSFGATSGVFVVDGYIDVNNGVVFEDSGVAGSYILFLSLSSCDASVGGAPCNGHDAITVGNNSNITIMNAQNGTVYFANNSSVKEAVGYKIHLKNNSTISYGSGIINPTFTSGPAGGYVLTYVSETQ
jgi:hypothetical protein